MKGFSAWPAIIRTPSEAKVKKGHQWVFFFGSHNYANIPESDLVNETDEKIKGSQFKH